MTSFLEQLMTQAVIRSITHVESGGLPFVGVIVDGQQVISEFGVNQSSGNGRPKRSRRDRGDPRCPLIKREKPT